MTLRKRMGLLRGRRPANHDFSFRTDKETSERRPRNRRLVHPLPTRPGTSNRRDGRLDAKASDLPDLRFRHVLANAPRRAQLLRLEGPRKLRQRKRQPRLDKSGNLKSGADDRFVTTQRRSDLKSTSWSATRSSAKVSSLPWQAKRK